MSEPHRIALPSTAAMYFPPASGKYDVKPGLVPLGTDFGNGAADTRVFQFDARFAEYRKVKQTARAERLGKYYQTREFAPEVAGVVCRFIARRLAEEYPQLFTLAEDLAQMELQVNVDEADVGQVRTGQQASFSVDAWPNRKYPASIKRVRYGSQTTDGVVSYLTVLQVDNSDLSLRPGMTATAEITTTARENALLVPNAALRFSPPAPAKASSGGIVAMLMPRLPRSTGQRAQSGEHGALAPVMRIAVAPWRYFWVTGTLSSVLSTTNVTLASGWFEWSVLSAVQAAYAARAPLYLALDGGTDGVSDTNRIFASADNSNSALRPQLVITYTQPGSIGPSAPQNMRLSSQ